MTDNLDCMDPTDLMAFWNRHQHKSRNAALALFGTKFPGYIRAMNDCANYASNKATAMNCRMRGDITTALYYESICERIYKTLPSAARW